GSFAKPKDATAPRLALSVLDAAEHGALLQLCEPETWCSPSRRLAALLTWLLGAGQFICHTPDDAQPDARAFTRLRRQLTIFNTQATVSIGGSDRSRPFQGQLSGFYYNGLKVLNMASEGNANIKINGSVRLVGDVPSGPGSARSTAMSPEMSTTFIETTTMMSTTTTRKHRSSSTVQHTADDIVSSAECSSDDEDLEECETSHAAKSSNAARPLRAELVIPVLQDPLAPPSVAPRAPFIPSPSTHHPLLTIIETTKESLSEATEAGVPCLSDQGSDDCDDDGLVISGYGSGEAFKSNLPPTDDEDFYTTFSLVTYQTLSTSGFEALPTEPGVRRVPGPSEVVRESSSTTGMVIGIVAAAALCILILLYAMYKYRNRDEGSYQVDESRNYITNSAVQSNGAVMKDKQQSLKGSNKKQKNKDKEYYV
ncbi:Neurexin-3-beta, partial [Dissostichus eleginoides]